MPCWDQPAVCNEGGSALEFPLLVECSLPWPWSWSSIPSTHNPGMTWTVLNVGTRSGQNVLWLLMMNSKLTNFFDSTEIYAIIQVIIFGMKQATFEGHESCTRNIRNLNQRICLGNIGYRAIIVQLRCRHETWYCQYRKWVQTSGADTV
jgi:hypothetical protein